MVGRQRHRLLVDLRRQPADHAVGDERRGARPGLVQLAVRGQRGVRPRLCGWPPTINSRTRGACSRRCAPRSATNWSTSCSRRRSATESRDPRSSARGSAALSDGSRRSTIRARAQLAGGGRAPGAAQRLDRGRRRLGLRHRLGRAGPRAGERARRQRAGARHRGLLEYRRPGVEVDAARRGGEVRRAGKRRRRRTWRCRRSPTATSTSRASPWAPTRSRRSMPPRGRGVRRGRR